MVSAQVATKLGQPIPLDTQHAVSVCFPTWESVISYVKKDPKVLGCLKSGYPRFWIHPSIQKLRDILIEKYAKENETCFCFPSYRVAKRCREYIRRKCAHRNGKVRILQLATAKPINEEQKTWKRECKIAVVFVDGAYENILKQYWQYTGEIISSRLAEYVLHELFIVEKKSSSAEEKEYIETRYGRNLNFAFADRAKELIKKRIATKVIDKDEHDEEENYHFFVGNQDEQDFQNTFLDSSLNEANHGEDHGEGISTEVNSQEEPHSGLVSTIPPEPIEMSTIEEEQCLDEDAGRRALRVCPERDVFLFPSGMASIFTAHRLLLQRDSLRLNRSRNGNDVTSSPPNKKTVIFGFPYADTLHVLQEFNETYFLGEGDESSMKELTKILHSGEQILAVFIETPSNPLLKMGNLLELKRLSELFGFFIIIDETVGGIVNIDGLPFADIVCSSLTKTFSGDSNVIGGSMVLNPQSRVYEFATRFMQLEDEYEDLVWCEDAIYLERNSRDFIARTIRINYSTEYLLEKILKPHVGENRLFKKIYYPNLTSKETLTNYDMVRCKKEGGYGGLFSLTFHDEGHAAAFYDNLKLNKGPSLGTNFTLAFPYTLMTYYHELDMAEKFGVERNLLRISVGLESQSILGKIFQEAIDKTEEI
ncbi:putative cystathionine gamma-synthase SPAR_M00480 [Saccharomyces paradoxus]|uniref:cystathionine gamma-synthase n=1 Tax=Saccharomyces paradoxus TaxID=27291 RepID=A0A8B8UWT9_SACPA|nr:uncharacterized protein SPAR_M00480 [Saccharomyces paradoxus]QHS75203.1 hypothetical protein SPAR_M00480 [Saccharomyces paradoxus]